MDAVGDAVAAAIARQASRPPFDGCPLDGRPTEVRDYELLLAGPAIACRMLVSACTFFSS